MDRPLYGPLVEVSCSVFVITESATEVSLGLQKVFSFLGTPRILHSDNGREFVHDVV